jgi:hypothetical protein
MRIVSFSLKMMKSLELKVNFKNNKNIFGVFNYGFKGYLKKKGFRELKTNKVFFSD